MGKFLLFTWGLRGLQISDSSPAYGSRERSRNTNQLQHFTKFYWFEHVQTVVYGWLEYRFVKTLGIKSRVTLFSGMPSMRSPMDASCISQCFCSDQKILKDRWLWLWFICVLIAVLRLRKYPNLGHASFVAKREKQERLQETHNASSSLDAA